MRTRIQTVCMLTELKPLPFFGESLYNESPTNKKKDAYFSQMKLFATRHKLCTMHQKLQKKKLTGVPNRKYWNTLFWILHNRQIHKAMFSCSFFFSGCCWKSLLCCKKKDIAKQNKNKEKPCGLCVTSIWPLFCPQIRSCCQGYSVSSKFIHKA